MGGCTAGGRRTHCHLVVGTAAHRHLATTDHDVVVVVVVVLFGLGVSVLLFVTSLSNRST